MAQQATAGRSGETLDGQFRLVRRLGEAEGAEVYEGADQSTGEPVVVRTLQPEFSLVRQRHQDFTRLPKALLGNPIPNVAPVLAVGSDDTGVPFVVEAPTSGSSLVALLKAHPRGLPVREASAIAGTVLATFGHLHLSGATHGKLHPGHISVRGDGPYRQPTLISASTDPGDSRWAAAYRAPERPDNQKAPTAVADVYGLGVLMHHLFTGRPPSRGFDPDNPGPALTALPPGLVKIICDTLRADPRTRIPDAAVALMRAEPELDACRLAPPERQAQPSGQDQPGTARTPSNGVERKAAKNQRKAPSEAPSNRTDRTPRPASRSRARPSGREIDAQHDAGPLTERPTQPPLGADGLAMASIGLAETIVESQASAEPSTSEAAASPAQGPSSTDSEAIIADRSPAARAEGPVSDGQAQPRVGTEGTTASAAAAAAPVGLSLDPCALPSELPPAPTGGSGLPSQSAQPDPTRPLALPSYQPRAKTPAQGPPGQQRQAEPHGDPDNDRIDRDTSAGPAPDAGPQARSAAAGDNRPANPQDGQDRQDGRAAQPEAAGGLSAAFAALAPDPRFKDKSTDATAESASQHRSNQRAKARALERTKTLEEAEKKRKQEAERTGAVTAALAKAGAPKVRRKSVRKRQDRSHDQREQRAAALTDAQIAGLVALREKPSRWRHLEPLLLLLFMFALYRATPWLAEPGLETARQVLGPQLKIASIAFAASSVIAWTRTWAANLRTPNMLLKPVVYLSQSVAILVTTVVTIELFFGGGRGVFVGAVGRAARFALPYGAALMMLFGAMWGVSSGLRALGRSTLMAATAWVLAATGGIFGYGLSASTFMNTSRSTGSDTADMQDLMRTLKKRQNVGVDLDKVEMLQGDDGPYTESHVMGDGPDTMNAVNDLEAKRADELEKIRALDMQVKKVQ